MGTDRFAASLFFQQLITMDNTLAPFDLRFAWESSATFTHRFEKRVRYHRRW